MKPGTQDWNSSCSNDQPLVTLLGGAPVSLAVYDSYGIIDRKVDEKAIVGCVESGFRAIKIKIGEGDLENDVANVRAVREMIGPTVKLMVGRLQPVA